MSPRTRVVLVAAGTSTRMGGAGARKPLLELEGRPILEHACAAFEASPAVAEVVVVAHAGDLDTIEGWRETRPALRKVIAVVPGGAERADSVRIGATAPCESGAEEVELICVHDAARLLVTPAAIERVLDAAAEHGAALLALPVRDTIKHSEDGETADRTVERARLWAAQTPQVFAAARFREILATAEEEGFRPTDDAALWERYVGAVRLVQGEVTNVKVTRPEDLELARAVLRARAEEESP